MCIKNGMTMIDPTPQQMEEWRKKGRATWASLRDVSQDDLKRIAAANHIKM